MEKPKRVFKKNYLVVVMDMYNYGESYDHSDYYTAEEALCVVKEIILSSFKKRGKEGYDEWMAFGESAYIVPINGAPEVPKFDSQKFVKEICGYPIYDYDFTDLNDEKIKHPDFPDYQPTDGDLVVIRMFKRKNKMKRLRALLDPEVKNLEFIDVEGVAVTLTKNGESSKLSRICLAWNRNGGRAFPPDSARRNGAPIDYEKFLKMFEDDLGAETQKSWLKD